MDIPSGQSSPATKPKSTRRIKFWIAFVSFVLVFSWWMLPSLGTPAWHLRNNERCIVFRSALQSFREKNNRYPATLCELSSEIREILKDSRSLHDTERESGQLVDGWGRPFVLRFNQNVAPPRPILVSSGENGKLGDSDDRLMLLE